jgi:predicted RNase H-like HicB family nuclease
MVVRYVLSDYVSGAMGKSGVRQIEDGTWSGRIPDCPGVIAFGASREECEDELRSTLEEWILLGLKLGHELPIIGGINLNRAPELEPLDSL